MDSVQHHISEIRQIKSMMEKSTRFTAVPSVSPIAAGIAGLLIMIFVLAGFGPGLFDKLQHMDSGLFSKINLYVILGASITFMLAFCISFYFVYKRSERKGIPIFSSVSIRVFTQLAVPMAAGGIVLIKLLSQHQYEYLVPVCLIFYGLALINGSKFTFRELGWVGYCELILGLLNLWITSLSVYFWIAGFGILHLLFGALLWYRYERKIKVSYEESN